MSVAQKAALVTQLLEQLQAELGAARQRAKDAADAATHEENRPENSKDMRSTEASYVARGQAAHVRELETALVTLSRFQPRHFGPDDAIALSALVHVQAQVQTSAHRDAEQQDSESENTSGTRRESGGQHAAYFLVPALGGRKLEGPDGPVSSLTPDSPLGRALIGLMEGESAVVPAPQGRRVVEVTAVG